MICLPDSDVELTRTDDGMLVVSGLLLGANSLLPRLWRRAHELWVAAAPQRPGQHVPDRIDLALVERLDARLVDRLQAERSPERHKWNLDRVYNSLPPELAALPEVGWADVDVVVEAVPEKLALKQQVFAALDGLVPPGIPMRSGAVRCRSHTPDQGQAAWTYPHASYGAKQDLLLASGHDQEHFEPTQTGPSFRQAPSCAGDCAGDCAGERQILNERPQAWGHQPTTSQ